MSPPSTESDTVRVAIALSALKHRPAGQSTASYILDLRAAFPAIDNANEERERNAWRTRALRLEGDLRDLQARYDSNVSDLESLRIPSSDLPVPPPRKKAKKTSIPKESEQSLDIDCLRRNFDKLKDRYISATLSAPTLFSSLVILQRLSTAEPNQIPLDHLIATATNALSAVSSIFQAHIFTISENNSPALRCDALKIISPILLYLISTAIPPLLIAIRPRPLRKSNPSYRQKAAEAQLHLDTFLNLIISNILVPLIKSFLVHSQACASSMLSEKNTDKAKSNSGTGRSTQREDKSDLRVDLLGLLGTVLSKLNYKTVKNRIALEAIRELGKVFGEEIPDDPPIVPPNLNAATVHSPSQSSTRPNPDEGRTTASARSPAERIETLARKDAAWYLCSILNLCCGRSNTGNELKTTSGDDGLLQEAILSEISRLLAWTRAEGGAKRVGWEVYHQMLLATCEQNALFSLTRF
ncbi:hypothetical protein BJ138DRAFT_1115480 [Hygrophoropsis aurantiaca]|uniref:Uncharacterized protein n=1 Tax=Hygrophoropsis aurantiaca TaxID=72124 RepID=A0ACB8A6L0_9AGAM|nr:hypothetical protein BJ138DRAFT_1115480 [Hygrophoropsis aurantiaca]